jgi:hypothetical protein
MAKRRHLQSNMDLNHSEESKYFAHLRSLILQDMRDEKCIQKIKVPGFLKLKTQGSSLFCLESAISRNSNKFQLLISVQS